MKLDSGAVAAFVYTALRVNKRGRFDFSITTLLNSPYRSLLLHKFRDRTSLARLATLLWLRTRVDASHDEPRHKLSLTNDLAPGYRSLRCG
jgi:hypothetical protein